MHLSFNYSKSLLLLSSYFPYPPVCLVVNLWQIYIKKSASIASLSLNQISVENNCSRGVLWKCRSQENEPRRGAGGNGARHPGPSLRRRHCPLRPHSSLSARENNTYRQKPPLRKKACPNIYIFLWFCLNTKVTHMFK